MRRLGWKVGLAVWIALGLLPLTVWGQGKITLSGFVDTSFFYENLQDTNSFKHAFDIVVKQ